MNKQIKSMLGDNIESLRKLPDNSMEQLQKHLDSLHSFYNEIHDEDLGIKVQKYYTKKKLEKIIDLDCDNLSKDFWLSSISPQDMEIELVENPDDFMKMCQITTSLPLESQIGRQLNIGVRERFTGMWLGFIKLSSPILSLSSRNNLLNETLNANQVNKYIINGSIILPTQPFGYNYLGGKLLSLICISNEVREMLKKKYPQMEPVLFETTSLWGSIKGISQYNGLKPYIKGSGLTKSDSVMLYPTNEVMNPIRDYFRKNWGKSEWNGMLVNPTPSGPKLREYKKMLSIFREHMGKDNSQLQDIHLYSGVPTQKGYYYSNFGIENWKDVIINGSVPVYDTTDKWSLDSLIEIWRKKAVKRWNNLKINGEFRTELEIWNEKSCKEGRDIIR